MGTWKKEGHSAGGGSEVPVLPCLSPKQVIKLLHAARGDDIGCHVGEGGADTLDDFQKALLHLGRWPPEDEDGLWGLVDKFLGPLEDTIEAGVGHHTEAGLVAHVNLIARGGSIVHADGALSSIDGCAQAGAQKVAGAGYDSTLVAVRSQGLAMTSAVRR